MLGDPRWQVFSNIGRAVLGTQFFFWSLREFSSFLDTAGFSVPRAKTSRRDKPSRAQACNPPKLQPATLHRADRFGGYFFPALFCVRVKYRAVRFPLAISRRACIIPQGGRGPGSQTAKASVSRRGKNRSLSTSQKPVAFCYPKTLPKNTSRKRYDSIPCTQNVSIFTSQKPVAFCYPKTLPKNTSRKRCHFLHPKNVSIFATKNHAKKDVQKNHTLFGEMTPQGAIAYRKSIGGGKRHVQNTCQKHMSKTHEKTPVVFRVI